MAVSECWLISCGLLKRIRLSKYETSILIILPIIQNYFSNYDFFAFFLKKNIKILEITILNNLTVKDLTLEGNLNVSDKSYKWLLVRGCNLKYPDSPL